MYEKAKENIIYEISVQSHTGDLHNDIGHTKNLRSFIFMNTISWNFSMYSIIF
jgi:hypothetical protein